MRAKASRHSRQGGFTAIEVAMVATVIAILALIVLPLFRNRVEEAKLAAAKGDLASLMKAEMVAKADTGYYWRLEDLDNVEAANSTATPLAPPANGITVETPPLYFTPLGGGSTVEDPRDITIPEWQALAGTETEPKFKGPYASFNRSISYQDLRNAPIGTLVLRSLAGGNYAAIRDIQNAGTGLYDALENRHPVDPWGNPYLFFPPSKTYGSYNYSLIVSLGPDGLPADEIIRGGTGLTAANYTREGSNTTDPADDWLGRGDDIEVRF